MKITAIHCRLFPGGALDARISQITDEHKTTTAKALVNLVQNSDSEHIIPSTFDQGVADVIAEAVKGV